MARKISIECPECSAKLNLSDSSKLGKKIKCPKCSEIFVAEAPEDDDLFDDDEDPDDEPRSSSRGKRGSAGPKESAKGGKKGSGKGNSSEDSSNMPLILGGIVGVIGLVAGGLFFGGVFKSAPLPAPTTTMPATMPEQMAVAPVQPVSAPPAPPQVSPAEKILGLRWMPPETDLLIHAKVADIWQAPLLKEPLSNPTVTSSLKDFEKHFGMPPSEIESISFGFVDFSGSLLALKQENDKSPQAAPPPGSMGFGGPPIPMNFPNLRYVVVIKTRKPLDLKVFSEGAPNAALQEKNGKTFFEVPAIPNMTPANGGWSPDSTTLILATTKELMATLERGETSVPRKEFKSIDHLPQLVIAGAVSSSLEAIKKSAEDSMTELPGLIVSEIKASDDYGLKMGSLGLTIKGGFDVQFTTISSTDEGAKKLKAEMEQNLGQMRSQFDGFKTIAPPLIAELGEMLFANLKIEARSQTVTAATNIPDSAKDKLEQLPAIVMMMAMTGGLGGPMGGPPSFGASPGSLDASLNSSVNAPVEFEKQPGETDSVEAASTEGLPEGMTLTARTAWSRPAIAATSTSNAAATTSTTGNSNATIDILIEARGDGLETICGATGASSKTIKLDGGATLKKSKLALPGGIDSQKTFLPFDLNGGLSSEHPPQTLRVRLTVDVPSKAGTKIDVLEGSFKYLTAENSQELTIENVPQTAKQPLKGADFKAGGVKLIRGPRDVTPESLKLECGKDHFLGRVLGTPDDVPSVTEVEKGLTIQRIYAKQPDGKFPDDFQIQFKLYSNVKEHTVTFRFENIPLPTPDSAEQQSSPQ